MKKNLTYILTIISFILFPLTVCASTKVELKDTSKGEQIATNIHFEEGFVGGLDLTLKIDGNISVTNFEFNSTFAKNNYYTYYKYNEDNHTLSLKVTTGGINAKHNLLNENKEVSLGKIILTTKSNETVNYSLETTSLTIIDNSWKSITIDEVITPTKDFTYQISTSSSKNKKPSNHDNNSENNTNPSDNKETNDKTENNTSNNQATNESTSPNKGNTSSNNSENNASPQNPNEESSNSNQQNPEDQENNLVDDDNNSSEDQKEENAKEPKSQEKSIDLKVPIIIGTIIIIGGGALFYKFKIKNK